MVFTLYSKRQLIIWLPEGSKRGPVSLMRLRHFRSDSAHFSITSWENRPTSMCSLSEYRTLFWWLFLVLSQRPFSDFLSGSSVYRRTGWFQEGPSHISKSFEMFLCFFKSCFGTLLSFYRHCRHRRIPLSWALFISMRAVSIHRYRLLKIQ